MSIDDENIYVITRTGKKELLDPNQITNRIKELIHREPQIPHINAHKVMLDVVQSICSGITTYEIDEYAANKSASMSIRNPYYLQLASRLAVDNHQKNTARSFRDKMRKAYLRKVNGKISPLLDKKFYKYVEKNADKIEKMIDYERDFLLDFFGFRTFQKLYALSVEGEVIERPQDMFMRASIAINQGDIKAIKETYDALSLKHYTQASPVYFNAGSKFSQFSSCFLLGSDDSLEGIMDTCTDMARISKRSGGIGVHVHKWRSRGAFIRGTNGQSNGIVPFLQIYNKTMRAFNQGGRRMGSAAVYLMPHHPDIEDFVKLRRPDGNELLRARDLFYALWIPDIFMRRVKEGKKWSLVDPDKYEDLSNYYGEEYEKHYLELEEKYNLPQIEARQLWRDIYETNVQTGVPYILFSDNVNRQSQQKNIGVIRSSNLCAEIVEYSDSKETAVCNLCSLNLSLCVKDATEGKDKKEKNDEFPKKPYFDFEHLSNITKLAVVNQNKIIDMNAYPTDKTKKSNFRHRPIGVGVQGLMDVYFKMRYPFESKEAMELNKLIFETMYFSAVSQSALLAKETRDKIRKEVREKGKYTHLEYLENGKTKKVEYKEVKNIPDTIGSYPSMIWRGGSPLYRGEFHWEMGKRGKGEKEEGKEKEKELVSDRYDWESLRKFIRKFGLKNSLLIALMPTASTSQLLGSVQSFEVLNSNIYRRKTLVGDFIVINKYLIHDLYELGIWNDEIKSYLLQTEGSVQYISGIPDSLKELYKTAWEVDQKYVIQQAIGRSPFVDQSMSLNLNITDLTFKKFTDLMFLAWKGGLKTGNYYLHSRPSISSIKFTIDPKEQERIEKMILENKEKSFLKENENECIVCSS